jgi:hypothetical protein
MKHTGDVVDFDETSVFVTSLPELPRKTID